jgi:hypothetical protein
MHCKFYPWHFILSALPLHLKNLQQQKHENKNGRRVKLHVYISMPFPTDLTDTAGFLLSQGYQAMLNEDFT